MTEQEWLPCTDPKRMLRFLLGTNEPRVQDIASFPACKGSDRKMRLFACACYHRIRHLLPNTLAHAAVELAERFADGRATMEQLQHVTARLWGPIEALEGPWRASQGDERTALQPTHEALALAWQVVRPEAPKAAYYASSNAYLSLAAVMNPGAGCSDSSFVKSQVAEERVQTDILRCIFGTLFSPVTLDVAVVNWHDGTIGKIAQSIYEERSFTTMPILADALEEAGCTNADILAHCRMPGPHTRGCWVIDLILKKE
jgi:hypothetical protein